MSNKEKNIAVFEIDELIKSTYNKIAEWHNGEASAAGLKQVSIQLIEDIAGATFKHLDIPFNMSIFKDAETAKKIEALKKEEKKA